MNNVLKWSDQEVSLLKDIYLTKNTDELMILFPGRSKKSIDLKAFKLNLHRKGEKIDYNFWTNEEIDKLIKLNGTMSFKKMADIEFNNRTATSLQKKAIKLGLESNFVNKEYSHNEFFFSELNLINCYFGGFSMGDASVNKGGKGRFCLSLATKDRIQLENLKSFAGITAPIKDYTRTKYKSKELKSVSSLNVCSAQQWLVDLNKHFNIKPNKREKLMPPSFENQTHLWATMIGLIDADGWIISRKKIARTTIGFVSNTKELVEWVKYNLESLVPIGLPERGFSKDRKVHSHKNYFYYTISGLRSLIIVDILKDFPVPKLARKWQNPKILQYLQEQKEKHPEYFTNYPKLV